ncbi:MULTISPECIES: PD-(D/E)XK nuclease-like domain-containing protein [unclassified Streptomyces]|uniref:PD-(D/E)XK nuclease-like domain-containing protein n=1 Tax=unclassified Streptomyces TaxID=2593676 RepID=UPI000BF081EF|nr:MULTISPECIES: PD-(D/E)XK nuclease-like domain-containing protein [unclassified Streptomyces]
MTTTLEPPVAAPAVIDGMSAEAYHADRGSISSTGLRKILAPGCPAQLRYDLDHPQPHKKEFDLGHAAHLLVLGEGPELEVIDAPDWKKVATRELRDLAYAEGKVPLLTKDHDMVQAMAAAIRQHSLAGPLFTPGTGVAEQSIFWTDPATGVRCRVRPDWLKQLPGLTLCVDYKTIKSADPDTVSKAIRDHAYHQQDALYTDGIWAALQPEDVRFIFVFQSKVAPYLITVRELADQDRDIGRARNERALRIFADCQATGIWPDWTGPVTDIPTISMPTWAVLNETEEYLR